MRDEGERGGAVLIRGPFGWDASRLYRCRGLRPTPTTSMASMTQPCHSRCVIRTSHSRPRAGLVLRTRYGCTHSATVHGHRVVGQHGALCERVGLDGVGHVAYVTTVIWATLEAALLVGDEFAVGAMLLFRVPASFRPTQPVRELAFPPRGALQLQPYIVRHYPLAPGMSVYTPGLQDLWVFTLHGALPTDLLAHTPSRGL